MSGIDAFLDIGVTNSDGRVVRSHSQRARSFLSNFIREIYSGFSGVNAGRVASSGTTHMAMYSYTSNVNVPNGWIEGGFGIDRSGGAGGASGIVVGSSNTEFQVSQTALVSEILHGTEIGTLYRGVTTINAPEIASDGQSVSMVIDRTFTNNSQSDVVVREVGLVGTPAGGGTIYYSRDVLIEPVAILPEQTLTVRIVIRTEL